MNRRAAILLAVMCFAPLARAETVAPQHPNVLMILADDMGWGDVRSHGSNNIDTPRLDKLADQGARFECFYVSPVCAPTRAAILTGRYPLRTGVHGVTRGYETMRSSEVTLAEVLKNNGYITGCFGKWHNGAHYPHNPQGQGFREVFGFCGGHLTNYFDATLEHNGEPVKTQGYVTDVITDSAIDFIEKNKDRDFFCYVAFNAPHSPWQVPDKYFNKYKKRGMDDTTACAYGMVENLDDNIGRLLDKLKKLKLEENTIVVFLTDNGPNTDRFNGGMKGRKGSLYDGGVRVPCFVRFPKSIKPGTRIPDPASQVDLFPTLLGFTGLQTPEGRTIDGTSLHGLLTGSSSNWRAKPIFTHWSGDAVRPNGGAIRDRQWLAVNQDGWKLHATKEPDSKDYSAENPEILAQLTSAYNAWFKDVTKEGFDPIPIEVGHNQSPVVTFLAHEAFLTGMGISYSGPAGWAHDWVTNWTDTASYPHWPIHVVAAGRYEVTLLYGCKPQDAGVKLRVEAAGKQIETTVTQPFESVQLPSPDRVKRIEAYEKTWRELKFGTLDLPEGRTTLVARALEIPGKQAVELKEIRLRRAN